MQDIKATLLEYEDSHALVQGRIHELNAQIGGRAPSKEESPVKKLNERRALLYTQLWDIEYAIRELTEYMRSVGGWEVHKKVG